MLTGRDVRIAPNKLSTTTPSKTWRMINIPTELLRTLVAVVDLRSFTKAAHSLGVTQPAVSAQIKRLQLLLDCELFDKSAPGVSLTPSGELLINYARRMLSLNDQIVEMSVPRLGSQALRVGVPGDFAAPISPANSGELPYAQSRHPFHRPQPAFRHHVARPAAGRARPDDRTFRKRHRAGRPPSMDGADGVGARAGLHARSRGSGAARHLRRDLCRSSCGRREPEQGAAAVRGGVHRIERGEHSGSSEGRARRQRDAAQPGTNCRHRNLGKSAVATGRDLFCGIYLGETGDRRCWNSLPMRFSRCSARKIPMCGFSHRPR